MIITITNRAKRKNGLMPPPEGTRRGCGTATGGAANEVSS